jgi:tetratricopeptide (TPR) repeat protein
MDEKLPQINLSTPPDAILQMIAKEREKKDNQAQTRKLVDRAIEMLHDYIVNLYFERAHLYQLSYMTERDKLEKGNVKSKSESLKNMEKYIKETEKYIRSNGLKRWFHRLYRFYGKLSEYRKNYKKAISYYKRSLKYWKKDPEYVEKGVPRGLELEGFLASATILSGQSEKGLKMARETYDKYENTKMGKDLKRKDYTTWAIWRTGCVIYAVGAFVKGKVKMDKKEALKWLEEAEEILNPPKSVKTWADFGYRKDEIQALRRLID